MFVKHIWNKIMLYSGTIDYTVNFTEIQPNQSFIPTKTIVIVGGKNWVKWAFIKCPCGCGDILTLSLMKSHNPNWEIKLDKFNRVTLYPSLWKKDGCGSHFFIKKGKVIWVE